MIHSEIVIFVCRWHAEILGWEDYTTEQVVTLMNDLLHFGFKTDCKNCTMVFIELCLYDLCLTHRVPLLRILLTNTKVPRSTKVLVAGVKDKINKVLNGSFMPVCYLLTL